MVSAISSHHEAPPEISKRFGAIKAFARVPFLTALMRWRFARSPLPSARRSMADTVLCARTLHPEVGPLVTALFAGMLDRLPARLWGTVNDVAQLAAIGACPLEQIAAPVLAIHGTGDVIVPFHYAEAVARKVPGAELMAIEGGWHVSLFTPLDEIRSRVNSFLAKHVQ